MYISQLKISSIFKTCLPNSLLKLLVENVKQHYNEQKGQQIHYLAEAIMRNRCQNDWFHGGNISKSHFRNVESADNMSPAYKIKLGFKKFNLSTLMIFATEHLKKRICVSDYPASEHTKSICAVNIYMSGTVGERMKQF